MLRCCKFCRLLAAVWNTEHLQCHLLPGSPLGLWLLFPLQIDRQSTLKDVVPPSGMNQQWTAFHRVAFAEEVLKDETAPGQ